MTTTLSFIVVLGILVTVHELGHFIVAKLQGIGVDRFSIGFPPKMFGFTRGETEYCVSWIPLGGYVKLRGEDPDEEADPDDPALYSTRPPHQRGAVILAGPIMNLVLAFIVMPMVFMVGMSVPAYLDDVPVAGWVEPGSPADRAGFIVGEKIVSVGGTEVADWEDVFEIMAAGSTGPQNVLVEGRGGRRTLTLDSPGEEGGYGILPPMDPAIGSLTPGYPAQEAGLEKGDLILSLGGVPVSHWSEMARIIHGSADKKITVVVKRGEGVVSLEVIPQLDEKSGRGLMGISPMSDTVVRRYGPMESLKMGAEKNLELLGMTFSFLWELVSGQSSIKNLGGPIMIFQVTGQAAKAGLAEFLAFMAFLSLQLGVLNLLPIPVLDGGHLVFLTAEGLLKRPLDIRTQVVAQKVGFFLLITLIIVISYNDIIRLLGR
ncbi:MAG: RIP metalloprotease RseP [bacterium]|nr:RIP metalloprotease RseP [bacterium]MDT8396880.1 RIP metalloprotease RseP [bacterium]